MKQKIIRNIKFELCQGDITEIEVDAVVNAANPSLLGGGGVDGAIHQKGGLAILEECKQIRKLQGGCKTGKAVFTTAGNLPAKYVIHTVGPIWQGGIQNEAELLASCYRESLKIANKLNLSSLAFPNISTGTFNYPKAEAAKIVFQTINEFIENEGTNLENILFICFDEENYRHYQKIMES